MDVDEIWLSLLIIAAISLCLPIVAPTPSLSQLFIFFKSIWQSWTIFFRHLVSSCPVAASVMCCVFKKSVCGFPLELTYLTKTTNCWRTEMSVRLVKALCCPFFFFFVSIQCLCISNGEQRYHERVLCFLVFRALCMEVDVLCRKLMPYQRIDSWRSQALDVCRPWVLVDLPLGLFFRYFMLHEAIY